VSPSQTSASARGRAGRRQQLGESGLADFVRRVTFQQRRRQGFKLTARSSDDSASRLARRSKTSVGGSTASRDPRAVREHRERYTGRQRIKRHDGEHDEPSAAGEQKAGHSAIAEKGRSRSVFAIVGVPRA
jgi:hypothetical protein